MAFHVCFCGLNLRVNAMNGHRIPSLAEADWAFHKVHPDQLYGCYYHERARGYGTGWKLTWVDRPWLELTPEQRSFLISSFPPPDYIRPSVWIPTPPEKLSESERSNKALRRYADDLLKRRDPLWQPAVAAVILDWRTSNTRLMADFKKLIISERKKPLSAAAQYARIAKTTGTGRRRHLHRRLVDIALARAAAAGFKRPGALKLLRPLLEHFNFLGRGQDPDETKGLFSGKNWSTTVRKAKESLRSYKRLP